MYTVPPQSPRTKNTCPTCPDTKKHIGQSTSLFGVAREVLSAIGVGDWLPRVWAPQLPRAPPQVLKFRKDGSLFIVER